MQMIFLSDIRYRDIPHRDKLGSSKGDEKFHRPATQRDTSGVIEHGYSCLSTACYRLR